MKRQPKYKVIRRRMSGKYRIAILLENKTSDYWVVFYQPQDKNPLDPKALRRANFWPCYDREDAESYFSAILNPDQHDDEDEE